MENCILKEATIKKLKVKLNKSIKTLCWIILFFGVYIANTVNFSNSYCNFIKEETIDSISKTIYESAARNLLPLVITEACAAVTLMWLKRYNRDAAYYLAFFLGLVIVITLLLKMFI